MTKLAKNGGKAEPRAAEMVATRPSEHAMFPRWMERFEDLFADVWPASWPMLRWEELASRGPPVDVYEEAGALVVKAELPGMKKEEIEVRVSGRALTISGRKEKEEKVERKDYRRVERISGAFSRTVMLPGELDLEKVAATYRDGVLELRGPKVEAREAKGRKIEVV